MSSHVTRVLALVAIVALIAWWVLARGRDEPRGPGSERGSAALVPELAAPGAQTQIVPTAPPPAPAAPAVHADTVTPRPELPALRPDTSGGPSRSPAERFAAEARDDHWARPTEDELRRRAAALGGDVRVDAIECKASLCKLALAGSTSAVGAALDGLGGPKGLGARIWLSRSSSGSAGSDGTAAVSAYVMYPPRAGDPEAD